MNILFSSLSGHNNTESPYYIDVLERLGHKVFRFSVPSWSDDMRLGFWMEPGFSPETSIQSLIRYAGFTPDLFLYIEPKGLIPRGMEFADFPTACILSDTHQWLQARQNLARFFDHVFLYHRNYIRYFNEHPKDHIHWHPYACDLKVFHPSNVERDIDIAFIGNLSSSNSRKKLGEVIKNLSQKYKVNEQRFYWHKEIPEIYSRSKIVLNKPLADDLNFRIFEAMSCGAMLLTQYVDNGQESLFNDGEHFITFKNEPELYDKVDYFLSHSDERKTIAQAGWEEIQLHHSLEQRVEKLIAAIVENPVYAAPIRRMSQIQIDRQYAWLYEYWRLPASGLVLAAEARRARRVWVNLLPPVLRSIFRILFR